MSLISQEVNGSFFGFLIGVNTRVLTNELVFLRFLLFFTVFDEVVDVLRL